MFNSRSRRTSAALSTPPRGVEEALQANMVLSDKPLDSCHIYGIIQKRSQTDSFSPLLLSQNMTHHEMSPMEILRKITASIQNVFLASSPSLRRQKNLNCRQRCPENAPGEPSTDPHMVQLPEVFKANGRCTDQKRKSQGRRPPQLYYPSARRITFDE